MFPMRIAVAILLMMSAIAMHGADIVIPAYELSAKDPHVVPTEGRWDGLTVCHGMGGFEEWTVNVKQAGTYYIHFRYAAGDPRPCILTVDGSPYGKPVVGEVTGGFFAKHLKWGTYGPFQLAVGQRKIRLLAKGHTPHFLGLVVSTESKAPNPDVLPKPKLTPRPQEPRSMPIKEPSPGEISASRATVAELLGTDEIIFIKRYTYSANHYYTEYVNAKWTPGGSLCVLSLKDGSVRDVVPQLKGGVFGRFDLSFDAKRVVFGYKKAPLEGYRIYEVNVDGTGLRQLTFPPANETELVKSYQVTKLYHHGTDDMHPCYLPDGGIAFISTRCQYGVLCDSPDNFTTTVLHRMDAGGGNLRQLTHSALSEAAPVLMEDGRILYTRWEYVDKGAVSVKCLWAMNPDGTGSSEVYGNTLSLPPTLIYGRPIPGQAGKFVVCGTPHYPQNGVGTIIRLDTNQPIRTRDPMTYITAGTDIRSEGGFDFRSGDGPWQRDRAGHGPLFRDPLPISDQFFLVAHKPAGPVWTDRNSYDLYLLDEKGNARCFHRDKTISCWQPMPLRPRRPVPVLASRPDSELVKKGQALCIVTDVYHGLVGVKRGEIKHIRVLEQVPRFWSTRRRWGGDGYDQQHVCITKDTHLGLKVQHGIVPVAPDGSAHFVVPAERNISLQALDGNYMAVQTERTYVNYMPGEQRSCIGCHETPKDAPANLASTTAMALQHSPSLPGPQPGEARGRRTLHYPRDVQPVWDKHCVSCHSGRKPKGGLNLSGNMTALFNVSYENLVPERRRQPRRDRGLLGPVIGENHPKTGNVHYLPARSLGSHASVLVAMLSKGKVSLADPKQAKRATALARVHGKVSLSREELLKVTNWVDTNCQYYGSYWGRRNLQYKGQADFRPDCRFEDAVSRTPPKLDAVTEKQ